MIVEQIPVGGDSYQATITAGTYEVTASAPGYRDQTAQVNVLAGQAHNVNMELQRQAGTLLLRVQPTTVDRSYVVEPIRVQSTLHFDANGGGTVPDDVTFWIMEDFVLPNVRGKRVGYLFQGWNTRSDGSGTTVGAGATLKYNVKNPVLYATWRALPHGLVPNQAALDAIIAYVNGDTSEIDPILDVNGDGEVDIYDEVAIAGYIQDHQED